MSAEHTLLYWLDDGWYVGQLKETPSVVSQAKTLDELKINIKDAFKLITEERKLPEYQLPEYHSTSIQMEIA